MPRQSPIAAAFPGTSTRIKPTDDLPVGSPERALFVNIVLNNKPGHFQSSDAPLLAAYVRACITEQTASSELAAAGYVAADGRPSGWLPILQASARTMSTFSRMLKLNPAGRVPSKSAEPQEEAPVSYYDRQQLERRDDTN